MRVMSNSLRGRTAVVTGAARGIGAALALDLARAGARVALVGLEPDELRAVAAQCAKHSPSREWDADVTDAARMSEVGAEIEDHFGRVDIVVANAGIGIGAPFGQSDAAAWTRVIEVNLLGSVTTARAFLPALGRSRGYFLQIASLAAMAPVPLMSAYCASKSGVEAFAHALRTEVAHQGIGVGIAYLSWTDTDLVRAGNADPLQQAMRARLNTRPIRMAPLEPAVRRLVAGIARRSAHVYGQPWVRAVQWLPRGTMPALLGVVPQARQMARVAQELKSADAEAPVPLGPGGQAAWAAQASRSRAGQRAGD
jgi:NAD(P)-dependent dehydrogenase (short-subunit alcohol dehydrogenase family)